jgi:drug/metabolite transporter (DMT)-like permease
MTPAAERPEKLVIDPKWRTLPLLLLAVGALLGIIGLFVNTKQLAYSYLLAFMFFLSICLGSMFLTILHHLFDANWTSPVRRLTEHIAFLLPVTLYAEPKSFGQLPHFKLTVWVGLVILAIFQYFLSMVLFLNVLTRLDATQAAVSNYLIPFFGVLLAALILGEKLTGFMLAGGILVLLSTLLVTAYEERTARRKGDLKT